jgi:hypothetical protein
MQPANCYDFDDVYFDTLAAIRIASPRYHQLHMFLETIVSDQPIRLLRYRCITRRVPDVYNDVLLA